MSLFETQIAQGRILSRLPFWKQKEKAAAEDILAAAKLGAGYLSLSWGKQSTCLAHMIHITAPEIRCVFWKNPISGVINDFDHVRDEFLSRWPVRYVEFPEGDTDLKGNGPRYMEENGLTVVYMGLASYESRVRKITLGRAWRHNIFRYRSGRYRCCPLKDWTDMDIAAYIAKHDIPVLSSYSRFGLQTRTSAGLTPGSHAEQGIDLLTSEQQARVRDYFAKGGK